MQLAGKPLETYWKAIQVPFLLVTAVNIAALVIGLSNPQEYFSTFGNIYLSTLLPFFLFGIAGYLLAEDAKATGAQTAWAGALTGILCAVVGIIVSFILAGSADFSTIQIEMIIEQYAAVGQAITTQDAQKFMKVGQVFGSLFSLFLNGGAGALMGWLGGLVAKKI